jgi:hypothetical protein
VHDALIDAAAAASWEADGFLKWWPDGFYTAPTAAQERYRRLAKVVPEVFSQAREASEPEAATDHPGTDLAR